MDLCHGRCVSIYAHPFVAISVPSIHVLHRPPPLSILVFCVLLCFVSFSRVGKHESVAVWGLTPAAVSSQQPQDGSDAGPVGSGGRGDVEANPTGLGLQRGQRSMLERLNDGDEDDASDSTQSSGEDNDLEITCKRGSGDSSRRRSRVGDVVWVYGQQ